MFSLKPQKLNDFKERKSLTKPKKAQIIAHVNQKNADTGSRFC
jgi:hypothetical protein